MMKDIQEIKQFLLNYKDGQRIFKHFTFSDEHILTALELFLEEKMKDKQTWKLTQNLDFKEDLRTMSVKEIAKKYNTHISSVYYHRKNLQLEEMLEEKREKCRTSCNNTQSHVSES